MINSIDEAIAHAKEKARELTLKAGEDFSGDKIDWAEFCHCIECAEEHRQLAGWLGELKLFRTGQLVAVKGDNGYHFELRESEARDVRSES